MKILLHLILIFSLYSCNSPKKNKDSTTSSAVNKTEQNQTPENVIYDDSSMKIIELRSPTNESLRGISIVDENVAWFGGANGTIIKTTDGGKNLYFMNVPYQGDTLDYRDIHGFDADTVILMNSGNPGRIYRTNNGGKGWKKVFNFPVEQLFFDAIEFVDNQFGIAYSDPINGMHFILVSGISGKMWIAPPTENLIPALEGEAGFAASGSNIAFTPSKRAFIGLGGPKGRMLVGEHPYKDWFAIETPIFQGGSTRGIYSINFKDNYFGVAVGGDYTLPDTSMVENSIYTTDGGITWQNPETPLSGYRSCVTYCKPANLFIAVGTNGIDVSDDNGKNWQKINDLNLNAIQFVKNSNIGYLLGNKGQIYKIEVK
ncbi:hypothetical protein OAB47_02510 [Vicingaceae bacterium]|jgi:photosystem II stability/assembly factor-like uncharacterized protein|nr:hypothetical protein [Vicingaceae bacterium]